MLTTYRIARAWPWPYLNGGFKGFVPDNYPYDKVATLFQRACRQLPEGTSVGRSDGDWTLMPHIVVDFVITVRRPDEKRTGNDHRVTDPDDLPREARGIFDAGLTVISAAWSEAALMVAEHTTKPN